MAKSQNFSVYLLKEGFNAENTLKEGHSMTRVEENNTKLPHGSVMFIIGNPPKNPWWKDYWGLSQNILQSSVGAIVFIPMAERWFALTFGSSYHHLKEASYEYDFGLKTTLNTLDPDKIKSTDILVQETAKRQRIQVPTASDLTFFDFNQDENIVKRLTGSVKEEFKDLMKNTTGASSLRFATSRQPEELPSLCRQLFQIYDREDYKEAFPGLLNITPVKDPSLIDSLDSVLMDRFNENSKDQLKYICNGTQTFRLLY